MKPSQVAVEWLVLPSIRGLEYLCAETFGRVMQLGFPQSFMWLLILVYGQYFDYVGCYTHISFLGVVFPGVEPLNRSCYILCAIVCLYVFCSAIRGKKRDGHRHRHSTERGDGISVSVYCGSQWPSFGIFEQMFILPYKLHSFEKCDSGSEDVIFIELVCDCGWQIRLAISAFMCECNLNVHSTQIWEVEHVWLRLECCLRFV
jgi:hypothetical protein